MLLPADLIPYDYTGLPRADPALRAEWERYYLDRGVGLIKSRALARSKAARSLRPPAGD